MMKALKILAIAAAPIILIAGIWMFMSSGKQGMVETQMTLCDLATGELVTMDRRETGPLPKKNKRDGKRTIYPVWKDERGTYIVPEHYRGPIRDLPPDLTAHIDLQTYAIKNPK